MLLEPSIDALVKTVGNPYKLAVLVGKRAKHYNEVLSEEEKEAVTEVTRAVNEVYEKKIVIEGQENN
ncbi:MAG: DNA-directed RNA polymerase subunit omega [Clostridia bacterium]|nr:DNA-directed RNA polymerase subunit omega [Clostridia bacterium]